LKKSDRFFENSTTITITITPPFALVDLFPKKNFLNFLSFSFFAVQCLIKIKNKNKNKNKKGVIDAFEWLKTF